MPLTVSINLTVAPLPENDVWFANAQAWANYWRDASGEATIDPAQIDPYVEIPLTLDYTYLNIDGADHILVNKAQWEEMQLRLNALNESYKTLRQNLIDAGFITL